MANPNSRMVNCANQVNIVYRPYLKKELEDMGTEDMIGILAKYMKINDIKYQKIIEIEDISIKSIDFDDAKEAFEVLIKAIGGMNNSIIVIRNQIPVDNISARKYIIDKKNEKMHQQILNMCLGFTSIKTLCTGEEIPYLYINKASMPLIEKILSL